MNVFRMFGFGDVQDGQGAALETSPGESKAQNRVSVALD